MIVNFVYNDRLQSVILPSKVNGQYNFLNDSKRTVFRIEGIDGKWIIKTTSMFEIREQNSDSLEVEPKKLYSFKNKTNNTDRIYLFTEEYTSDRMKFFLVNYTAFAELYGDNEDDIVYLSREGTKYGIYFILSSLTTNGVRFRITQNFKQHLVLQLNDDGDYSTILGKTDGLFPAKIKGRGLVKADKLLEFQTAHLSDTESTFDVVKAKCAELSRSWKGNAAEKIPILPSTVDAEFLLPYGGYLCLRAGLDAFHERTQILFNKFIQIDVTKKYPDRSDDKFNGAFRLIGESSDVGVYILYGQFSKAAFAGLLDKTQKFGNIILIQINCFSASLNIVKVCGEARNALAKIICQWRSTRQSVTVGKSSSLR